LALYLINAIACSPSLEIGSPESNCDEKFIPGWPPLRVVEPIGDKSFFNQ